MNALIPMQFEGAAIRIVEVGGEPWFVGKDVAEALGYADPTTAMRSHCRGVQKLHPILDALGRTQEARILSEPDVLRLIVSSTLPAAERFERWVFEEVLPSIRKNGGYQVKPSQRLPARSGAVADLLMIGRAIAKVKGVSEPMAMACTLEAIESVTGLPTTVLSRALPSIEPEDKPTMNATAVGKELGLSARDANQLLFRAGLHAKDERKEWRLTDEGTKFAETTPFHRGGHSGYENLWRPSVVPFLAQKLKEAKEAA